MKFISWVLAVSSEAFRESWMSICADWLATLLPQALHFNFLHTDTSGLLLLDYYFSSATRSALCLAGFEAKVVLALFDLRVLKIFARSFSWTDDQTGLCTSIHPFQTSYSTHRESGSGGKSRAACLKSGGGGIWSGNENRGGCWNWSPFIVWIFWNPKAVVIGA